MHSLSYFVYFFIMNDLNVVFSIFLAAGLLCRRMQKRTALPWRMALLALLGFLWSVLINLILYAVSGPVDPYEVITPPAIAVMILKYMVYFGMTFGGIRFCVRCGGFTLLYCATLSYCMEHLAEKVWEYVEMIFDNLPDWLQIFIKFGFILFIYALVWFLLLRRYSNENEDLMRRNRTVLRVAFMVILLDIVLGAFSTSVFISDSNYAVKLIDNVYSILANILILFFATYLLRVTVSQYELETVKQLQKEREEQFRRDQKTQDALNVKCHDLKYQLSLLEEKMDKRELDQIRRVVEDYDTSIHTGHPALDVVLANKQLVLSGQNITLTVQADGKALDFMTEVDIYTLFGNILDNAIEASESFSDEGMRVICLTVQKKNSFLYIHEENYYQGEITMKNGLPLTKKEGKNHHGFGTHSIKTIAEKYRGQMEICAKDGIYTLDIVMSGGKNEKTL